MAKGNAVTLIFLFMPNNYSGSCWFIKCLKTLSGRLIKNQQIPYRKVGSRRRVLAKDILDYKANIDKARLDVLQELSEQAQMLDMGTAKN